MNHSQTNRIWAPSTPPPAPRKKTSLLPSPGCARLSITSSTFVSSSSAYVQYTLKQAPDPSITITEPLPPPNYPSPTGKSWDPNYPSTWPILRLPYHTTQAPKNCSSSMPTSLEEMLVHVHYKGAGAQKLSQLLFKAIDTLETEEEKVKLEKMAFLNWPCNVGYEESIGYFWKEVSGMTRGEITRWREWRLRKKLVGVVE